LAEHELRDRMGLQIPCAPLLSQRTLDVERCGQRFQ
jgi:hypothetical protein